MRSFACPKTDMVWFENSRQGDFGASGLACQICLGVSLAVWEDGFGKFCDFLGLVRGVFKNDDGCF